MKNTFKRVLSLVLALVMIIGMAPAMTLHAHAVDLTGLTVEGISLSYEHAHSSACNDTADTAWTASEDSVTGTVSGYSRLGGLSKGACSTTLTITNNSGSEANLSFTYNLANGGSLSGAVSNASGSYGPTAIADGASITITVTSQSGTAVSTLSITSLKLEAAGQIYSTTFKAVTGGTYTVDGTEMTADTVFEKDPTEAYAVTATVAQGYKFVGWFDETTDRFISTEASASIKPTMDGGVIYPAFVPATTAVWVVGAETFIDLEKAINHAAGDGLSNPIVLTSDGTITGNYTIPASETLLIPFDSASTVHTEGVDTGYTGTVIIDAVEVAWEQPYAYRTLTMASGANITVNGALNVGGEHHAGPSASGGNSKAGSPTGPVGFINMASGSSITVQSGGNLYAWGFITGDGTVTAKSGAAVHETMQVADFRGGTATTSIVDNAGSWKVFPFSQYYVQNIEVPLTLEKGATEYATTTIFMQHNTFTSEVKFIGDGALFTITNGSVTKEYDGSRDRLNLTVNGTVGISSMELTVSTMTINSGAYVLPINSNISINVLNGSVVNLTQDLALLPGSEVNVEHGASMNIPSGYNLYVYDGDQWGSYVFSGYQWIPVPYAPGKTYTRTQADVTADVKVDLNGSLTVAGGAYTTAGGANIYSSAGTGSVTMSAGAGTATETYQATQSGSNMTAVAIPITSVKLNNGSTYTETGDAAAGDIYYWNGDCSKWMKNKQSGHSYESVVTAPTCTTEGYTTYTCTVCGHSYTGDTTAIVAHTYGDGVVTAPTCTEQGYTTYTCTVCGHSYQDNYTAVIAHTEVIDAAVAATCTSTGLTEGKHCSVCGVTTVAQEVIPMAAHTEVIDAAVAATCTTTGLTEGKHCSVCSTVLVAQTEVAALGHSWGEGVINPDATCTEDGVITYTCTVCGGTKTEAVSATGHTEVADEAVAATCTTPGKTAGSHCSVCDAILSGNEEIPATGHSYESVVTAPTCTEQGYTTYICSACGDSYKDNYVGTTEHSYGDWYPVTEATCTGDGLNQRDCANCDHYETQIAPALGHGYDDGVVTAPTCTAEGYTTYTCTACGDSYVGDYVDALGHTWGDWTVVTEATCTEAGEQTRTCSACDASETQSIAASGHSYESVVTAPGCTSRGYTTHTCACGDSYVDAYVDQLGHSYGEWYNVSKADCTTDGLNQRDCANCDHYETEVIPATGHSFTNYVDDHNGYETATCDNCDATDTKLKTGVLAGGQCGDDLYWELAEDGTMTISGTGEMWHFSEEPKPWLDYQSKIKKLVVEDGATTIGSEAFRNCGGLTTVTFPTTLKTIGYYSFDGCNLSNVVIPEGVTLIEAGAFNYNTNMGTLSLPSTLETIGDNAFADLYLSEGLVIPAGVTSIGKGAFAGYTNWSGDATITFLGDAPAIGEDAFGYVTATCYYPANNATWTEAVMLDYGGTLTWVINCDHTDVVVDEAVAPTCTETGLTEGKHCSVCNATIVAQEVVAATGHNYENGTCSVCGDVVYQVNDHGTSLLLEGMVHIKQYWGVPGLSQEQLKAAEFYMIVTPGDGSEPYRVDLEVQSSVYNGAYDCTGATEGIPAKNMIDGVTMQGFIEIDGVTYASEPKNYGVLTYCEGRFEKSSNEKLKSMLVSLLNYGAAAQKNFNYKTDTLVNAKLEEYIEKYNLNSAYLDLNWTDDYLTPAAEASAAMAANFADGTLECTGKSLLLEGAISVNFYCSVGEDNSIFQGDTAMMYYWTAADYAELEAAGTPLSKENASYTSVGTSVGYTSGYGHEYKFTSEQVYAKNLGDTLYAVMTILDTEGVEHYTNVFSYSAEVYAKNKLTDGKTAKIDELCQWMVVYGERAKIYFG